MAVRTITTRLALDGEAKFKQEMTAVNASLRAMKSEIALSEAQFRGQANTVEALTAKDKLFRQEIEQQTEKVKALEQALKDAAQVWGEDSNQVSNYQTQLNRAKIELAGMNQALEENTKYLHEAKDSVKGVATSIDEFGFSTRNTGDAVSALAGALQAAGVAYTLKEIADAIHACVDASMDFESAMANFNKVAKLSDSELAVMKEQIKQLSTEMPATTSEIAQVAEASRRLGISKEYVLEFSRVMLDLGNVSDLSSNQAATVLARFANITKTAAEDYSRLGSTIVALGNNLATSESEITNMSSRLAAAGRLARLSEAEIMGLAAAMSSVGIEAEAGGTAMTQTLTAMEKAVTSGGEKLNQFAQVAGMSSQQFVNTWKNDPITAIQAFIGGLGQLDSRGESATQVLEELGLSGIRQSNMLKSLALASETLTFAVDTANQAWANNTELAETAAAKYDTTEAKLQMAANAANNLKIAVGDQLTPALGILADVGTGAFSFAADFVEENPILVSAITGVVAAAGVMTAGFTVFAAKAALATLATTAWGSALLATPIGPIAAAIGVLVAAVTAFASAANGAESAAKAMSESVEAGQAAYEEQQKAISSQRKDTELLIAQLEELAGTENRSAAEKEKLLAITEELNAAVPGLGLEYDALTDSLNMTTEQLKALAAAELDAQDRRAAAEESVRLEREEIELTKALEEARSDLASATEALKQAEQEGAAQGLSGDYLSGAYEQANQAAAAVNSLEEALEANRTAQEAAAEKLEELGAAAENTGAAFAQMAEESGIVQDEFGYLIEAAKELEEATLYVSGAHEALSDALKEQEKSGSLSLATTQALIDAGYGAALAMDEESGAVTVNEEAYLNLAAAQIEEKIQSLEAQKQSALTRAAQLQESAAVNAAADSWMGKAAAIAAAKAAEIAAGQADSIEAQIQAMKKAQEQVFSFSSAATGAARRSSSASKKAKTQAQKDLEEYKTMKAELDHQKATDLVDEEAYYRQLAGYRDRYLTDEANLSEYRKVTEQIYKYDKSLADREAQLWADQTEELVDQLEKRVKAAMDQQDKMADRMRDYGDLFEVEDGQMSLNSLQDQITAIEAYGDALDKLRERGVSSSLMDEVMGMDVDSATQYANQLLAMGEEQWEEYNSLWEEKRQRAAEIAEEFFSDQIDALENEYNDKLGEALDTLTDTSFGAGVDTGQRLIDGLASMESALYGQAQAMADRVSEILAGAGRVPSNSELAASFSTDRIRERYSGVTPQDLQNVGAGIVNGVNTGSGGGSGDLTLKVNLNGRTIAEETLEDFRTVGRERPETLDDK